jgi:hypothetical protein
MILDRRPFCHGHPRKVQKFWRIVQNAALGILQGKWYVGTVAARLSGTALAAGGCCRNRGLAPNATYFVAARREPSGIPVGKPGGLRRSAKKNAPYGSKISGMGR